MIAGLGIFCGCVGKSAQFPLHVWLPDAMEGPTPVSALVHSATMVAAGVYLVGRFYPVFTPEVLLVIAYAGCITLFIAATIAITATDIKRVLAYSTVSQLGYMMLALGVGGWVAGLFHLITHAFFKSLLVPVLRLGDPRQRTPTTCRRWAGCGKKMPWTAYTMLAGCLAISGAGVPLCDRPERLLLEGLDHRPGAVASAMPIRRMVGCSAVAAGGAAITAFYMFRLWYMTFAGEPRDHHVYEHAHESPQSCTCRWWCWPCWRSSSAGGCRSRISALTNVLEQARPAGLDEPFASGDLLAAASPCRRNTCQHDPSNPRAWPMIAFFAGLGGLRAGDARSTACGSGMPTRSAAQFAADLRFLRNKWYFDELYARDLRAAGDVRSRSPRPEFDRHVIDGLIDGLARWSASVAVLDDLIDRYFVDGAGEPAGPLDVSAWACVCAALQTGKLRQYVMLIVIGTVALFIADHAILGLVTVHKDL